MSQPADKPVEKPADKPIQPVKPEQRRKSRIFTFEKELLRIQKAQTTAMKSFNGAATEFETLVKTFQETLEKMEVYIANKKNISAVVYVMEELQYDAAYLMKSLDTERKKMPEKSEKALKLTVFYDHVKEEFLRLQDIYEKHKLAYEKGGSNTLKVPSTNNDRVHQVAKTNARSPSNKAPREDDRHFDDELLNVKMKRIELEKSPLGFVDRVKTFFGIKLTPKN